MQEQVHDRKPFFGFRKRKEDSLPYSMEKMKEDEKKCCLCGPDFDDLTITEIGRISPEHGFCSFACIKRYVREVLAKPNSFDIKHGQSDKANAPPGRIFPD
jgi:hypothetical protein